MKWYKVKVTSFISHQSKISLITPEKYEIIEKNIRNKQLPLCIDIIDTIEK